jgi:MFS family permease
MSQEFTMSVDSARPRAATPPVLAALLPIIAVVFIAFLVIGLALPVLPLHVHQGLGLGAFVVGLVAGAQFAASLLSRFWAGHFADSRGAKRASVTGLLVAAAAGLLYLLSLGFVHQPGISVTILLLGRAVLGGAESFIVTGAFTWGLALAGPENTGQIMAWIGTAMYAAFAIGAGASWHRPLRRLRFHGDCARNDVDPARLLAARCAASHCRAAAPYPS